MKISPAKEMDFTKGAVKYKIKKMDEKPEIYLAEAVKYNNPVLDGFYADPEVLYSENTGKFYIYPTSDGFTGWSGTYFKVFSSDDLVHWTDEGKIIQLGEDVKWTNRNAWAPCIVEKKINGHYKYFYYFTAAQRVGVAVADQPTGPFTDLGKPLIENLPNGINYGQNIDPDVFTDPQTNKSYLYWGNGFMAGAELNDDMMSVKQETITLLKLDRTYREGTYVFYRNGVYYFMWSEDDTRSPNYRVRYATSDAPLGNFVIPQDNIVIEKDAKAGIYGTGHNSVVKIPGKDEWYIVYHRFNYPNGITMGDAAGYNREVCIDKLEFDTDGKIKQTTPTHKGIAPVVTK
ncbi:MAG: family 43 glycosylhydrolase [Paludibacteraceae bacterium]